MRTAAKTDGNQRGIVDTFRKAGAGVIILSALGKGVPDLLIWRRGKLHLIEIKSKRGKFTPDQIEFISNWPGPVKVIRSCLEAVDFINDQGVIK